jgi:hypothetical protein
MVRMVQWLLIGNEVNYYCKVVPHSQLSWFRSPIIRVLVSYS